MPSLKELIVKIGADTKGLTEGIDKATGKLSDFGSKATSVGSSLSMSLTAPIAAVGAGILYSAGQFEASMNKMQGISGVTGASFDGLRTKAKELGASTAFSASEAAQGMIALSQAGLNADQVMAGIEGTLQLAAAGGLELGEASGIAANAMAQFGLDASQVERVANAMAATASSSTTDIQQLAGALKFGGLAAASAGMSFEQASAALGILANKGMAGFTSGERLRSMLGSLAKPTDIAKAALVAASVAMGDVDVEARGLPAVLDTLKAANLTTAQAIDLFGVEAKDAAMALVEAGGTGFDAFTAKLTGTDAAAVQAAANMKGFEGGMKALGSAVEGLAIAIAEAGLLEWATGMVDWFTELVRSVSATSPELLRLGTIIAGVAAALGPAILAVGGIAAAWGAALPVLSGAVVAVGSVAAVLSGPVGITVAAAAAGLALGGLLTSFTDTKEDADVTKQSAEQLRQEIARLGGEVEKQGTGETWGQYIDRLKETTLGLREVRDATREYAQGFNAVSQVHGIAETSTAQLKEAQRELAGELAAGRIGIDEFRAGLDQAKDQYKNAIGSQGIGGLVDAVHNFANAAPKAADEGKKTGEAVAGLGASAATARFEVSKLVTGIDELEREVRKQEQASLDAATALEMDLLRAAADSAAEVRGLSAATLQSSADIQSWTATAADSWNATAAKAAATANEVDAAFKAMGLSTKTQLEQAATDAETNFNLIAGSGQASAAAIDTAWIQMLEARKAALIANGSDLGTEEQKILDDLLRRQGQHATDSKTVWETWADGLKGVVNNLDIGGKIFSGDFSPGRWKETLKGIAGDFLNVFLQPVKDAINDFITGGLKGLSNALGGIGSQIGSIFGGGSSATDLGGYFGGITGGSNPSGGAGALAGGVFNQVTGAITAGASVADAILSHFGRKRAESTANAIEENTRYHMLLFADYRESVGFFQNDELQRHRGLFEYMVANGDDMKASLWSIRDSLANGIGVSGISGEGAAVIAAATTAAVEGLVAPIGSRGNNTAGGANSGNMTAPIGSRGNNPSGSADQGTFSAPGRSRTAQILTAEQLAEITRNTIEARNPLAVIAAQLGNPLAQLVTGSNFLPEAVETQTAAIETQTASQETAAAAQTEAIRQSGDATSHQLTMINETLQAFIASVKDLLGRDIVIAIDGQEIARASGAGSESLRAFA